MTQARRWTPEKIAELHRRHNEEGISWNKLAIEHGISRQAMWWVVNREAYDEYRRSVYKRKRVSKTAASQSSPKPTRRQPAQNSP
jgi:transposase-like protein